MCKKSWPIIYSKLLYRISQDFFDSLFNNFLISFLGTEFFYLNHSYDL